MAEEQNDVAEIKKLKAELNKLIGKGEEMPPLRKYKSAYFNSGCCCFNDGDITGIEIENGFIRLIKWSYKKSKDSKRSVLEEMKLESLITLT